MSAVLGFQGGSSRVAQPVARIEVLSAGKPKHELSLASMQRS